MSNLVLLFDEPPAAPRPIPPPRSGWVPLDQYPHPLQVGDYLHCATVRHPDLQYARVRSVTCDAAERPVRLLLTPWDAPWQNQRPGWNRLAVHFDLPAEADLFASCWTHVCPGGSSR